MRKDLSSMPSRGIKIMCGFSECMPCFYSQSDEKKSKLMRKSSCGKLSYSFLTPLGDMIGSVKYLSEMENILKPFL